MCLSGSSDGTVRLWDIGQQRTVQTYTNFHSSPQHHHVLSHSCFVLDSKHPLFRQRQCGPLQQINPGKVYMQGGEIRA